MDDEDSKSQTSAEDALERIRELYAMGIVDLVDEEAQLKINDVLHLDRFPRYRDSNHTELHADIVMSIEALSRRSILLEKEFHTIVVVLDKIINGVLARLDAIESRLSVSDP
jgi:hypothetical protein